MPQQPGSEGSTRRKKLDLRSKLLPPRFRRPSDDTVSIPTSPDAAPGSSSSHQSLPSTADEPIPPRSLSLGLHSEKSTEEEVGERIGEGAARGLQARAGLQEPEKAGHGTLKASERKAARTAIDARVKPERTDGVSKTQVNGIGAGAGVGSKEEQDLETPEATPPSSREELDPVSPTAATGAPADVPAKAIASSSDPNPRLTIEEPSPPISTSVQPILPTRAVSQSLEGDQPVLRKQSLAYSHDHRLVRHLYDHHRRSSGDHTHTVGSMALDRAMVHRKIWVKRTGASATLVQITEDDLVDDVREMILKKYANSLGRSFDAPDVTLRIVSREHSHSHRHAPSERVLGPEEHMTRTLDTYYPGGQTVDEALIIDVPTYRRTPRHSPQVPMPYYSAAAEDMRPAETDQGYFPPVLQQGSPSPSNLPPTSAPTDRHSHHPSISVLNTGMLPPIPSPGTRARAGHRPRLGRNNTASPTVTSSNPPFTDNRSIIPNNPPPLSTPPLANQPPIQRSSTPPPRPQSPRPPKQKRPSKKNLESSNRGGPLLDGTVPPINVLIVEDNIINLKLLEAFMKRLKVRWHTAMNGRDAVKKWKEGGFHLVLMDIQLPIMSGLEATKEIRRLERCNGVGVLAASEKTAGADEPIPEKDQLPDMASFKSSVIIVALTASSLQSDRHEALAAGCNDFLTKPVNFVWLERKVTEWGCMQALIDFDGWRAWKALPTKASPATLSKSKAESASSATRNRTTPFVSHISTTANEATSSRGATHSGYGSSSSPQSSEHSGSGHPQPDLVVQAATPPVGGGGSGVAGSTSPRLHAASFDGAPSSSSSTARRPSPLVQSSLTASPPMKSSPSPTASRASPKTGSSSPTMGRSNGISSSGGSTGSSISPREREFGDRMAKRASFGLGVANGRLSGVAEEGDEPSSEKSSAQQRQRRSQQEPELGSVGA